MNPDRYGISDPSDILKNVVLVKLVSGEVLISYSQARENGLLTFLPYQFNESDQSLTPFLPIVKNKIFFFPYDHIILMKEDLHNFVIDRFKKLSETLYKSDIEDLIVSCSQLQMASAASDVAQDRVTLH